MYDLMQKNKLNTWIINKNIKTLAEVKTIADFKNNECYVRKKMSKDSRNVIPRFRKIKNKSQEYYRGERVTTEENENMINIYHSVEGE